MGLASKACRYRSVRLAGGSGGSLKRVDHPVQVGRRGLGVQVFLLIGAALGGERAQRWAFEKSP